MSKSETWLANKLLEGSVSNKKGLILQQFA